MADFGGVLRKALEKLPRDSGAARREIYARARIALLKELRAVNPPVHAREIARHRLQLEDSIRQVEKEVLEGRAPAQRSEADQHSV